MTFHVDYKSDEGYKDYNGHKRHDGHEHYDSYDNYDSYNGHKGYGGIKKLPAEQGFQKLAHSRLKAPRLAHLHFEGDLMGRRTL